MQPATVLAGPIEFSPAQIAFFFLVLALAALVLSAPGWAVLGGAAVRRAKARGAGRSARGWAWVGGASTGMGVSALVASAVGATLDGGSLTVPAMVLASWAACWGLAVAVWPSTPRRTDEGWGR